MHLVILKPTCNEIRHFSMNDMVQKNMNQDSGGGVHLAATCVGGGGPS